MTELKRITDDFLSQYEQPDFPEELQKRYDLMSCLSAGHGTETYLVCPKGGEERYVAKCYDKKLLSIGENEGSILRSLDHPGLPRFKDEFENDATLCIVREFIDGVSLDRYAEENELSTREAAAICLKLCGILEYIHGQTPPVIHRDIKPQNVVMRPDGSVALIDFDISRVFDKDAETDTQFFGTRHYAAPEQYGFMQTDCRADIFSFGVLLRWLVSGTERRNDNVRLYRPIQRIIKKCTAFSPDDRYQSMTEVKKALLCANPRSQGIRAAVITLCCLLAAAALAFGGVKVYQYVTFDPFADGNIPAYLSDGERVAEAVEYIHDTFGTDMFDDTDAIATVGDLRTMLVDVCGLDETYVWAMPTNDVPGEYPGYFLPWGWDPGQTVPRGVACYACVKAYWPEVVSDWSGLKDDTGEYPGTRVAMEFAEEHGLLTGMNRPDDITMGELALVLANTHRVYTAMAAG